MVYETYNYSWWGLQTQKQNWGGHIVVDWLLLKELHPLIMGYLVIISHMNDYCSVK
jgi:hypothetical protein